MILRFKGYTTCFWFSLCHQAQICLFISIWWWARGIIIIILPSNIGSFSFTFLFKFLACSSLFAFIVGTIGLDMTLLTTSKTCIVCRIEIIHLLTIVPIWRLVLVPIVLLQEFAELSCEQVKTLTITALTWVLTIFMTNIFQSNASHMLLFMFLVFQPVHLKFMFP